MILMREASGGFEKSGDYDWDLRYIHEKEEAAARYGDSAVDHDLPLAEKLRRDGDRSRKQAPIFHKEDAKPNDPPPEEQISNPPRASEVSANEGEATAATIGTPVSKGPKYWAEGKLLKAEDDKPEMVQFNSPAGVPFTIGRAATNDLSIVGVPAVSVNHCSVRLQEDGDVVMLTDTSLNGTFINGTLVGKGNEAVVPNGAVITFIKNKPYPQLVLKIK
mmetsp:Transcript_62609/g.146943  ORF Transcript_62609/g.146943 Transcript_62609/m.146943 type:complete len:219 (-) Transcript_62609:190-846(-)